jgi:xylose isomerase
MGRVTLGVVLVAQRRHKIHFKSMLFIELTPREPTKHRYDYGITTAEAPFRRYRHDSNHRIGTEAQRPTLNGHSFLHEVDHVQG